MIQFGINLGDFFNKGSDTAANDTRFMNDFAWKQSLRNEEFQRDLAQHGLRWRTEDAQRAGLHPLVGAGINPAQGGWSGPAFVGAPESRRGSGVTASYSQDVSRARAATMTAEEKEIRALELARLQADTAESFARKAIAERELAQMGKTPPMPQKYIQIVNEHGDVETIYNPDIAAAMMADPLGTWANSFRKTFGGPDSSHFGGKIRAPLYRPSYYSSGRGY